MLILLTSTASAQNTGPLNKSPRRRPQPEATTEATRKAQELPKVKTRTRQVRPKATDPLFTSDTSIVTVDVSVVDKIKNDLNIYSSKHLAEYELSNLTDYEKIEFNNLNILFSSYEK